jgi:hypothetical protein
MEEEPSAAVKKALKTPIRAEIEARRKTIATPAPAPMEEDHFAASFSAGDVTLKRYREESFADVVEMNAKDPKIISRLKLFAALETRRRPKKLFKSNLFNAKLKKRGELRKNRVTLVGKLAIDSEFIEAIENRRQSLGLSSDAGLANMFTPLKRGIEDKRKSFPVAAAPELPTSPISTKKEKLIVACQQISLDAFASALNQNATDASEVAIAEFMKKPSRFSLSPNRIVENDEGCLTIENPQPVDAALLSNLSDDKLLELQDCAESISALTGIDMSTAEAVAVESFALGVCQCDQRTAIETSAVPVDASEYFGASLTKLFCLSEEFEDDSDRDYRLVSEYARDLQESGGIGSAAAYGTALDTFLADPIKFRSMFAQKKSINRPQKANPRPIPEEREVLFLGASLNRLFQDNFGKTQDEKDFDLVSAFAEDLEQNGNVSSAIAYGVALDTFLADPIEFRARFGSKTRGVAAESKNEAVEDVISKSNRTIVAEITQPLPTPAGQDSCNDHKPNRGTKRKQTVSEAEEAQNYVIEEAKSVSVNSPRVGRRKIDSNQQADIETVSLPTRNTRVRSKASSIAIVENAMEEPAAKKPTRGKTSKNVEVVIEEIVTAILCDGCDAEYFLDDVGLKSVPKGDWFCSQCDAKKQAEKKTAPKATGKRKVTDMAPVAEVVPSTRKTRGKVAKRSDEDDAHSAAFAPEPAKRATRSRK